MIVVVFTRLVVLSIGTMDCNQVKPVRDSVVEALQVWKAIPDAADSHMPPPPPSTTTGKGVRQAPVVHYAIWY
jgi:hypothetical protein